MTGKLVADAPAEQGRMDATRFIGPRTFRLQDGVWTEASLPDAKDNVKVVRVEFDSKEYWDLLATHPELRDVLALGTDVRFALGDKICEIHSKKK
jgi:hypothetical protein